MLMTYILNTMESLEASRWHNEAFLCLHHHTSAFPNPPMRWRLWRYLVGTTKRFIICIIIHQLSQTLQCNGNTGGVSLAQRSYSLATSLYTSFPSQAVGPLFVHNNTAGSGDLYRATLQRAQFAIHLPSVPFCPSSTIGLP